VRGNVVGIALALLASLALAWWIGGAEASCEERGGVMVWDVDMASSSSYGECVGP
jgi:hypothetical protein